MARIAPCLLAASLGLAALQARAERIHFEVAADGPGDFTTVQRAIDHVPDGSSDWAVIHIHAGRYFEKLVIPASKQKLILVGDGRETTVLEYDQSEFIERKGGLVATPVLTNRAQDVVIRALSIRNLAREPGGSGGKWDAAIRNYGDRLILHDVFLRGDHDTLLIYGLAWSSGIGPGRVYVRDSHIQGRGDFIAAFGSAFIERSVLETIRDRGHFLFHMGRPDPVPDAGDALVVRDSTFTGRSLDPMWPTGATNLFNDAHLVLVGNVFDYNAGANRPIVHFHDAEQPLSSKVQHFGNTQRLSSSGPLIWNHYSVPGPPGTPRRELPVTDNDEGEPIIRALRAREAAAITPAWLFGGWDPRQEEPRSACEDGIDNDGDGALDLSDRGCASIADFTELGEKAGCGLGGELVFLVPLLARLRRACSRRLKSPGDG